MISLRVFIDAGPFIAVSNKDDPDHKGALKQFAKIAETKRTFFTSDYVLDEVLSFTTRKTKNPRAVLEVDRLIQESANIRLLKVDEEILTNSKIFLKKYPEILLSLTDWTSAALAKRYAIEKIYSYDSDFDKLKGIKEFKHIRRVETL